MMIVETSHLGVYGQVQAPWSTLIFLEGCYRAGDIRVYSVGRA